MGEAMQAMERNHSTMLNIAEIRCLQLETALSALHSFISNNRQSVIMKALLCGGHMTSATGLKLLHSTTRLKENSGWQTRYKYRIKTKAAKKQPIDTTSQSLKSMVEETPAQPDDNY
eukprot:scaffold295020_cov16-Prasinocladus_malaysianus.AAC.1